MRIEETPGHNGDTGGRQGTPKDTGNTAETGDIWAAGNVRGSRDNLGTLECKGTLGALGRAGHIRGTEDIGDTRDTRVWGGSGEIKGKGTPRTSRYLGILEKVTPRGGARDILQGGTSRHREWRDPAALPAPAVPSELSLPMSWTRGTTSRVRSRRRRGRDSAVARGGVRAARRSSARKVVGSSARSKVSRGSRGPRGISTTRLSPPLSSSRPTCGADPHLRATAGTSWTGIPAVPPGRCQPGIPQNPRGARSQPVPLSAPGE